jgi:hypothetical protein
MNFGEKEMKKKQLIHRLHDTMLPWIRLQLFRISEITRLEPNFGSYLEPL